MKIGCHCGAVIFDQTDNLPQKGHIIPDQEWFATYDAIDAEVIDPLVAGQLTASAAYMLAREIIRRSARAIWECRVCGRLYIDDLRHELQSYVPESDNARREILRSRDAN